MANRSASTVIGCKTPFELSFDSPVDYSQLTVFCCHAYHYVRDDKLELRTKKCIFLMYASGIKVYKVWCNNPKAQELIISWDIKFNKFASLD